MNKNKQVFCDRKVTITHEELVDVCKKAFSKTQIASWDVGTWYAIQEQFDLLVQMEKAKYGWFHKYSNKLFITAATSVALITIKSIVEGYMGGGR